MTALASCDANHNFLIIGQAFEPLIDDFPSPTTTTIAILYEPKATCESEEIEEFCESSASRSLKSAVKTIFHRIKQ